jgi:RNA polymerase sigma-70 factor (ECF subfamily)
VTESDQSDIRASLSGDGEAYARIVRKYESRIAKLMWRFSRDVSITEELVQDVFVEAYFSLSGFRGDAPLLHWLRRIATRVGYRFWRQRDRQKKQFSLLEADGAESPPEKGSAEEAGAILDSLLARLGSKDRLILTLHYFDQCSMQEIAERMGWNVAMVKMRAHRARKRLKMIAEREKIAEDL